MGFLGSLMCNIVMSADKDNFIYSFPIHIPLMFFFCLIVPLVLAEPCQKMSGDSEWRCLIPDFNATAGDFTT